MSNLDIKYGKPFEAETEYLYQKKIEDLTAENVNYKNSNLTLSAENERLKADLKESQHWHNEARSWNKPISDMCMKLTKQVSDLEAKLTLATDAIEEAKREFIAYQLYMNANDCEQALKKVNSGGKA